MLGSSALIKVAPGLMIWTLIAFGVTFFVLKRYAFGPIQKAIDDRRERIRQSIEEADRAREEARHLLDEQRKKLWRVGDHTDIRDIALVTFSRQHRSTGRTIGSSSGA